MVTKILRDRQYEILMDGSHRLTVRNRRHLRKVEKPVEEEPGLEEEEEDEGTPKTHKEMLRDSNLIPNPIPVIPLPAQPEPVQAPVPVCI